MTLFGHSPEHSNKWGNPWCDMSMHALHPMETTSSIYCDIDGIQSMCQGSLFDVGLQCYLPWKQCISGYKVIWKFMLHFQSGITTWSLSVDLKLTLYDYYPPESLRTVYCNSYMHLVSNLYYLYHTSMFYSLHVSILKGSSSEISEFNCVWRTFIIFLQYGMSLVSER